MPIREYECKECRLKFETIELVYEEAGITCPRCHSENVERKLSMFSSQPLEGKSCRVTRKFG